MYVTNAVAFFRLCHNRNPYPGESHEMVLHAFASAQGLSATNGGLDLDGETGAGWKL